MARICAPASAAASADRASAPGPDIVSPSHHINAVSLEPSLRSCSMADIARIESLFFAQSGIERRQLETIVADALQRADDGELFLEHVFSESLVFDDGRLKSASFNHARGFGLRAVAGETTGYAHAAEISESAIRRAARTVKTITQDRGGTAALAPVGT